MAGKSDLVASRIGKVLPVRPTTLTLTANERPTRGREPFVRFNVQLASLLRDRSRRGRRLWGNDFERVDELRSDGSESRRNYRRDTPEFTQHPPDDQRDQESENKSDKPKDYGSDTRRSKFRETPGARQRVVLAQQ